MVISASHGHDFEKRKASFGTVGKKHSYFLHGAKETQNRSVIVLFWLPTVPQFVSLALASWALKVRMAR